MLKLFNHKKFQAGIGMSATIFLGQFFPALAAGGDVVQALAAVNWLEVSAPVMAAILAQGVADHNKEAEKVKNGKAVKGAA